MELPTSKERLQALVNGLTDEDADLALQLFEGLFEIPAGDPLRAAGVIVPPKGSFAKFEPLVVPGPLTSEMLIADRR